MYDKVRVNEQSQGMKSHPYSLDGTILSYRNVIYANLSSLIKNMIAKRVEDPTNQYEEFLLDMDNASLGIGSISPSLEALNYHLAQLGLTATFAIRSRIDSSVVMKATYINPENSYNRS